jgi:hypothetical protein
LTAAPSGKLVAFRRAIDLKGGAAVRVVRAVTDQGLSIGARHMVE